MWHVKSYLYLHIQLIQMTVFASITVCSTSSRRTWRETVLRTKNACRLSSDVWKWLLFPWDILSWTFFLHWCPHAQHAKVILSLTCRSSSLWLTFLPATPIKITGRRKCDPLPVFVTIGWVVASRKLNICRCQVCAYGMIVWYRFSTWMSNSFGWNQFVESQGGPNGTTVISQKRVQIDKSIFCIMITRILLRTQVKSDVGFREFNMFHKSIALSKSDTFKHSTSMLFSLQMVSSNRIILVDTLSQTNSLPFPLIIWINSWTKCHKANSRQDYKQPTSFSTIFNECTSNLCFLPVHP